MTETPDPAAVPSQRRDFLPPRHAAFLERTLDTLPSVPGLVGLAAGGSFVTGQMDELSDLDFVVAVDPGNWPEILDRRRDIAGQLGPLLAAFTGEHVREPRLLICLYGPPLLHVDLKFVSLDDAHVRVEDPVILWERDGALSTAFRVAPARYPMPDRDWIEDRFWVWVHYTADKIERGELFDVLELLAHLRGVVLGPLALAAAGARPDRVRRIETAAPEVAERMRETAAVHDAASCLAALDAAIHLYVALRDHGRGDDRAAPSAIERAVRDHVAGLPSRLGF